MLRITTKGPIFDRSGVRSVVRAEFGSANDTARKTLVTASNRYVVRAFGAYEKGWRDRPTRYGSRAIVTDVAENPRVHASVHETGRQPNTRAGGVRQILNWIELRGIVPTRGNTAANRLGMAFGISRKHAKVGWPNLGSHKSGYYPGQAPKPIERAMQAEAPAVANTYEHAVRRIARRLGG